VFGDGVGECAAACVAGVFGLEDGLKLIFQRARTTRDAADEESTLATGLREALDTVEFAPPRLPLVSSRTGQLATDEVTAPDYWCRRVPESGRFAQALATLAELACNACVEVGPHPMLSTVARQSTAGRDSESQQISWLPSLRRERPAWRTMLRSLSTLYVHGATVDWRTFDAGYNRRRISLPTYPFQRKRYWIERHTGRPALATAHRQDVKPYHPLLGRRVRSLAFDDVLFESLLSTESWPPLADHRFFGVPILPGACQLTMAVDAIAPPEDGRCTLADVVFAHLLAVPDGQERCVQMILSADASAGRTFRLAASDVVPPDGEPSWTVHATGQVLPHEDDVVAGALTPVARERFVAACRRISGDEFYDAMRSHQVELGPSFRVIESAWVGDGEVLCRLTIPDELRRDDAFRLHPLVLDACLQVMGGISAYDTDATLVPTGVARYRFLAAPETERLWCHVRIRDAAWPAGARLVTDVCLFEESGRAIAALEGLRYEKVPGSVFLDLLDRGPSDLLYRPSWVPRPREGNASQNRPPSRWLVLDDGTGLGVRLVDLVEDSGGKCIVVTPADCFQCLAEGRYQLDPARPDGFAQLFEAVAEDLSGWPDEVVYLWRPQPGLDDPGSAAEHRNTRALGCGGVLHLIQALTAAEGGSHPRVTLVTQGAQAVLDTPERLSVEQAALWGLGRTAEVEIPDLRCSRVDLDPAAGLEQADWLFEELCGRGDETEIALRVGERYVARFARMPSQPTIGIRLDSEGTYLVTGGTGALGVRTAEWLIARGARHLTLVSRRGSLEANTKPKLAAWRQAGAEVELIAADVSRYEDVEPLMARLRETRQLKGIIHAAGMLDDATLGRLTPDRFEQVMAAKVDGAWNVHWLSEGQPLDFFVAFSSIASLLGSPGQANYAAANASLDALVHHRRALGLPGLSINWGPWGEAGMAAELDEHGRQTLARRGLTPLRPSAAFDALSALISSGAAQAAVVDVDWTRYSREIYGQDVPPSLRSQVSGEHEQGGGGEPGFRAKLGKAPADRRPAMLESFVGGLIAELLGDVRETLPVDEGFYELGIDSLSVMLLRNRLQSELGVSLPATLAFEHTTIRSLTDYLARDVLALDAAGSFAEDKKETVAGPADSRAELSADLDDLSEDELARRLAEKLASMKREHDGS